ncbi:hypothetical protein WH47_11914 [Habropoda laboriosa]|uniref:Uncharacterized protein n=1 Tax=Habropoda laboriosa TaxID=597456 RepID=A0A0L7R7L1_9HYME|nr:hypothetical protein WH47_11914 [Habropoda laboriosa]
MTKTDVARQVPVESAFKVQSELRSFTIEMTMTYVPSLHRQTYSVYVCTCL